MIGKSLNERYTVGHLQAARAARIMNDVLAAQAHHLVAVRAEDARMIACLVVRADPASVRLCRDLGFAVKRGATGVFGLLGDDAAGLFPQLSEAQRDWLSAGCGPRETKVLLIAGGTALVSLETSAGKVAMTVVE
jgi:hypothetical protein